MWILEYVAEHLESYWGLYRIFFLATIPLVLLQIGLMTVALVSIAKKAAAPSGDRILWVLLSVFIPTIGSIIYFAVGSKMLDEKATQTTPPHNYHN